MKFETSYAHFCPRKWVWKYLRNGGHASASMCWYCSVECCARNRAPSQYPKRRLFVRSREVSKPRDRYFKLSYRFEIWQAHRQHCCRSACQISERSDKSKYKSRGFETLRDLTKRRLFGYWDGALVSGTWTVNYIPQILWVVITCPCHWYLILAQHFSFQSAIIMLLCDCLLLSLT